MKPVMQTRLMTPDGPPANCFQAAVASLLECPIEWVPDEAETWKPAMSPNASWRIYWSRFQLWLASHNLAYLEVSTGQADWMSIAEVPVIICGPSPRDPGVQHAVVGKFKHIIDKEQIVRGVKSVFLHDPHPDATFLHKNQITTVGLLASSHLVLCHGQPEDYSNYDAFCNGCDQYQRSLFGKCRTDELTKKKDKK